MQQEQLDWGHGSSTANERRTALRGDVVFASAEAQSQRSADLLGAGALLVTLPSPTNQARGRLGEILEELVERELARMGAPSPYLAAWSAMPEDAVARLADQLFRARTVGASGIAIAIGSLLAIATPVLTVDDSETLRWLARATEDTPLVLLLDDADLGLAGYAAPIALGRLLRSRGATIRADRSSPVSDIDLHVDLDGYLDGARNDAGDAQLRGDDATTNDSIVAMISVTDATASADAAVPSINAMEAIVQAAAPSARALEAPPLVLDLESLTAFSMETADPMSTTAADAPADATVAAPSVETLAHAAGVGAATEATANATEATANATEATANANEATASTASTEATAGPAAKEATLADASTEATLADAATEDAADASTEATLADAATEDAADATATLADVATEALADATAALADATAAPGDDASTDALVEATEALADATAALADATAALTDASTAQPAETTAASPDMPTSTDAAADSTARSMPIAPTATSPLTPRPERLSSDTASGSSARRATRRVTAGIPVSGPTDAWRSWAIALSGARGAQPLAAFERIFAESYVPLSNAIAAGLDDARALRAYDEFRHSFEDSYTDAFMTFGATNRRPRLVMDAYDLASKQARLSNARSAHVLVVDSMRFDVGCLVRDALAKEATGIATLTAETILWSALPTTSSRQLETLARGLDALRAPSREEPSESLRGRAAEVVRRVRLGSRELYKLDLVPSMLQGSSDVIGSLEGIATATAEAIARHISTLHPRTLLYIIGDHGFSVGRRGEIQTGGASPEEVLVPAFAWLIGDQH